MRITKAEFRRRGGLANRDLYTRTYDGRMYYFRLPY